jgi:hypothetical protein
MQQELSVVGIDIAKQLFPIAGLDAASTVVVSITGRRKTS